MYEDSVWDSGLCTVKEQGTWAPLRTPPSARTPPRQLQRSPSVSPSLPWAKEARKEEVVLIHKVTLGGASFPAGSRGVLLDSTEPRHTTVRVQGKTLRLPYWCVARADPPPPVSLRDLPITSIEVVKGGPLPVSPLSRLSPSISIASSTATSPLQSPLAAPLDAILFDASQSIPSLPSPRHIGVVRAACAASLGAVGAVLVYGATDSKRTSISLQSLVKKTSVDTVPETPTSPRPGQGIRRVSFTDDLSPSLNVLNPAWGGDTPPRGCLRRQMATEAIVRVASSISQSSGSTQQGKEPFPEGNGALERFSESSSSSEGGSSEEDSDPSLPPPRRRARKQWRFLRRNLHNVALGMTQSDYHAIRERSLADRQRFIRVVQEAREREKASRLQREASVWQYLRSMKDAGVLTTTLADDEDQSPTKRISSFYQAVYLLRWKQMRERAGRGVGGATKGSPDSVSSPPPSAPPNARLHTVMKELESTERMYVKHLRLLVDAFHRRLLPIAAHGEVKASDLAVIFSNIPALLRLHQAVHRGLVKHIETNERLEKAGWILNWDLLDNPSDPPRITEEMEVQHLTQRRSLEDLQLLFVVFKDQVTARGGAGKAFEVMDEDQDGLVSKDEFAKYMQSKLLFSAEAMTRIFHQVDTDEDGFISCDELQAITADMLFDRWKKSVMCRGEPRELFASLDQDKNGLIDESEFRVFVSKLGFTAEEATRVFYMLIPSGGKERYLSRDSFTTPLGLNVLDQAADVGELLQLVGPLVRTAYTQYINNFEEALKALDACRQVSSFAKVCKEVVESGVTNGLDLADLLITPVQRIPRYVLLLKECYRHIPGKDSFNLPLAERIDEAINSMSGLAKLVDESVTERQRYEQLKNLAETLTIDAASGFKLLVSGRVLLKHGRLTKVCGRSHRPFNLYLFNDVLLYANPVTKRVSHIINVEQIELLNMEDQPNLSHAWMLKSPKQSFVVYASSEEEKDEWARALLRASDARRAKNPRLLLQPLAPVWVGDDASSTCMVCSKPFSIFRRRHHCYHCGCIVCRDCSRHRFLLPHIKETEMVQVCRVCFQGLTKEREELLQKSGGNTSGGKLGLSSGDLLSAPSLSPRASMISVRDEDRSNASYNLKRRISMRAERVEALYLTPDTGHSPPSPQALPSQRPAFRRSWRSDSHSSHPPHGTGEVSLVLPAFKVDDDASATTPPSHTVENINASFVSSISPEHAGTLTSVHFHDYPELKKQEYVLAKLQSQFVGPSKPIVVRPGRSLVRAGVLEKLGTKGQVNQYRFLLFSDVLMYCSELRKVGKLLHRRTMPLLYMTVEAVDEPRVGFRIACTEKSFEVRPVPEAGEDLRELRNKWMADIQATVRAHHESTNAGALDGTTAGVPVQQSPTSRCGHCNRGFSAFTRSAHCKACGGLFCKLCANKQYYTSPGVKGTVCPKCFTVLRAATIKIAAELLHLENHNPPEYHEATSCQVCSTKFSVLRVKKVCWSCCSIVCRECAPNKVTLQRLDPSVPLRVCNPCYKAQFGRGFEVEYSEGDRKEKP